MSDDDPLFEVTTAAASAAARRLTTVAAVTAIMDEGDVPTDADIEAKIDAVTQQFATAANLASDGINIPTFASEGLRATWDLGCERGRDLMLPWRPSVTAIASVVEDGVTLTSGTDFKLRPGGVLRRYCNGVPICWSSAVIVVSYTAGWSLPDGAPDDLAEACAEQVKYRLLTKTANPGLRSYTVNDLRSETYNVPGGDTVTTEGLLVNVQTAVDAYSIKVL